MDEQAAAGLTVGGLLLIYLFVYLGVCYVLYRIGAKFGIGSYGGYCVPIYNIVLLCRCAGLSGWYTLVFFIPIISIAASIHLWGAIAQRLGKNFWLYGLGSLIIGIPIFFLAFDRSRPVAPQGWVDADVPTRAPVQLPKVAEYSLPPVSQSRGASVHFLKGDLAGNTLELPPEGIIIGRDPKRANLVIPNPDISSVHVRIQPQPGSSSGVVIEDLGSTNGTYYKANGGWLPIATPLRLAGATTTEIRLTDIDIANFEVHS